MTEDGLPSSEVYFVMQDSRGNMWFGTDRGIARFDGYSFRTYTYKDGLIDNTVFKLQEDNHGRIWMYTYTGRLFYLEGERIFPYKYNNILFSVTLSRVPLGFFVDSLENVNVAIRDLGEFIIDATGKTKWNYKHERSDKIQYYMNELPSGYIITSAFSPLAEYKISKILHKKSDTSVFFSDTINVVSGILDRFAALRISKDKLLFSLGRTLYETKNGNIRILFVADANILYLYLDRTEKIWVCTENGLRVFEDINNDGKSFHFLAKNSITGIVQDKEGGYWITSLDNGVFYMPVYGVNCIKFNSGLIQKAISIESDSKSFVYAGCWNGSLVRIKNPDIQLAYHPIPYKGDMPLTNLSSFFPDDKIYMSRTFPGYYENGKFNNLKYKAKIGLKTNFLKRRNGDIFAAGTGMIVELKGDSLIAKANLFQRINCLAELDNGRLIFGSNRGVFILEEKSNEISVLRNELNNIRVDDIKLMNDVIFFATKGKGIMVLNDGQIFTIDESKGLCSDLVNKICIENNNVWCATNKGISKITYNSIDNKYIIINIRSTDGLLSDEINDITSLNDSIFIASNAGVSFFNSHADFINHTDPEIYINSLLVNNSEINAGSEMEFKHDNNNIHIGFNAVSFRSRENILYNYRLITGKDTVSSATLDRKVQFLSLQPGKYHFEVTARNSSGVFSNEAAVFDFVIMPAWWQAWWFRVLIILSVFATFFYFYKSRIRNIKRAYEMERGYAAMQLTALRSQMNPHFIFNVMNSIRNFMQNNDMKSAEKYLISFSRFVRFTLDNSEVQEISLEEELKAIRSYTELEMQRFDNGFLFTINCDSNIDMSETMLPSLLLQPFVENAIKHGISTKSEGGEIKIDIHKKHDSILITISDNGVGIRHPNIPSENGHHVSHGNSLTFERIEAYNKAYNRKIQAKIIHLNDENSSITGTRVEVEI